MSLTLKKSGFEAHIPTCKLFTEVANLSHAYLSLQKRWWECEEREIKPGNPIVAMDG